MISQVLSGWGVGDAQPQEGVKESSHLWEVPPSIYKSLMDSVSGSGMLCKHCMSSILERYFEQSLSRKSFLKEMASKPQIER